MISKLSLFDSPITNTNKNTTVRFFNILASDEPGGNRNRSIKVNAQHNVRKRAI